MLYDHIERPELQELVPATAQRVLDVGCSTGGFAQGLKRRNPARLVVGIEPNPEAARLAESHCDEVLVGNFPDVIPDDTESFDVVSFNDVLEHIVDPWVALKAAVPLLADGGVVLASIPNVAYWDVIYGGVMRRNRWDYVSDGVLDRTHLRWFTSETMVELFESAGLTVDEVRPIGDRTTLRSFTLLNRLTRGRFRHMASAQYALVGHTQA